MTDYQTKFQQLLRELFQFDCADLDFGIYRIMNYKRQVIERFITQDLPQAISRELEQGVLAEQAQAAKHLEAARQKVLEALGEDALDATGNLAEKYRETKAGREYLAAQDRAKSSKGRGALEAAIYNHLYTFFSRYWQDGDFISKRRYSKRKRYAIPYNGEEVYLYWANHDQYYVKTGEYFTDYTWKAPNGVSVHFKLKAADVEQNNVKGEKRFFLPRLDEIVWDETARTLTIPFEFRPLTAQEANAYGSKNQQEAIIAKAVVKIPERPSLKAHALASEALSATKPRSDGSTITLLGHHLRQYTRRNTSDFFIHKDLKGFLSRELDFYLKNEVLNLEEMETAGEGLSEGWFQMMRLIKKVGGHIIDFLAQIEEFQKMLWEKRKFVTETFYCITVGNIPQEFYPEIAACEVQWEEWKALFSIDEEQANLFTSGKKKKERRIEFLKAHPTLVLDTRYFTPEFTDRLLAAYDNLDEMIDGLLVHSENWQALNLLAEKYRERVKCVYIDPPFNTGDDFLYKDTFRNSTWLAMITDRFMASLPLFFNDGNYFLHLDYNAMHYGKLLLLNAFPELNEIIYNTNATRDEESGLFSYKSFAPKFVRQHDTILHAFNSTVSFMKLWKPNRNTSKMNLGQLDIISIALKPNPKSLEDFRFYIEVYEGGTLKQKDLAITEKIFPIGDIWNDLYSFTQSEMRTSENVSFPTQKPENLLRRIIQSSTIPGDFVLDFFAGSATTAIVAHKLRRKYISVEQGEYFNETYSAFDKESQSWVMRLGLLGRIKNALFGDKRFDACGSKRRSTLSKQLDWGGGGFVKIIRLESYEDALNNIAYDESSGQQGMQFKDYLLQYMLKWETRASETLLSVEKLTKPFSYQLHLHRDSETRVQPVDLPETFAYLIGLDVHKRRALTDNGRRYLVYRGETRQGRKTVVIWRETKGWTQADYERDRDFVSAQGLTNGADEVFVNGDSFIPNAWALEKLFKERMFAKVEG